MTTHRPPPPSDDPPPPPDPPERVSGADRFATAADICAAFVQPNPATVYVATGLDFPDALTGGVPAALRETCMLLTLGDNIPTATTSELQRLAPQSITVLGGGAAVSDAVVAQLGSYTDGPVHRLDGRTRFETAAAISVDTFAPAATRIAFVATGLNFPDALAGCPGRCCRRGTDPAEHADGRAGRDRGRAEPPGARGDRRPRWLRGRQRRRDAQLRQYAPRVTRVAGADRFATSVALGQRLLGHGRPSPLIAFVATGIQFPDALAGGASPVPRRVRSTSRPPTPPPTPSWPSCAVCSPTGWSCSVATAPSASPRRPSSAGGQPARTGDRRGGDVLRRPRRLCVRRAEPGRRRSEGRRRRGVPDLLRTAR
jgi:hypothetical protein